MIRSKLSLFSINSSNLNVNLDSLDIIDLRKRLVFCAKSIVVQLTPLGVSIETFRIQIFPPTKPELLNNPPQKTKTKKKPKGDT